MLTLRRRKPLTPVLCDGVKKDPRPSLGDNVDERGCWLFADVDGRVEDEEEGEGEFMMREYTSFSRSKSAMSAVFAHSWEDLPVGKKISKKPCLTSMVSQGIILPPILVWTTGPFLPSTVSGSSEKSATISRCPGIVSRNFSRKSIALVGIQSGLDRLGANGSEAYMERMNDDWMRGGVVDGDAGRRR